MAKNSTLAVLASTIFDFAESVTALTASFSLRPFSIFAFPMTKEKTNLFATISLAVFIIASSTSTIVLGQGASLEAALPMIRQSGDANAIIGALSGAASQHVQLGNLEMASKRIDEAIEMCRTSNNTKSLSTVLMISSQVLNKMDDEAAKEFLFGLLKAESGNTQFEIEVLRALSPVLDQSGETVMQIQVLHDYHKKLAETQPGSQLEAQALQMYASACMSGKLYDLGVPALKKAKALAIKIGDPILSGTCDMRFAQAQMRDGLYKEAKQVFETQLAQAKKSGNQVAITTAQQGLITALVAIGDQQQANSFLDQLIATAKTDLNRGIYESYKAVVATQSGDFAGAATLSSQAIASKQKLYQAYPAEIRGQIGGSVIVIDALSLSHYQMMAGNANGAELAVKQCEQAYQGYLDSIKKAAAVGAMNLEKAKLGTSFIPADISSIRQQILVNKKQFESALVEAERGRGQLQAEAMRRNFGAQVNEASTHLTLDTIRQIAAKQNVTFVEYSLVNTLDTYSRQLVHRDHPLRRPTKLYIWVVQPSGQITFKSVELKQDLTKMIDEFRDAIISPPDGELNTELIAETGQALHEVLIAPIKTALPADPDSEVVIVPQGGLYAIPFAALQDADGKHLIDHHTLTTSGSIDLYRLSVAAFKPSKFDKQKVLIVGNPEMPAFQARPDKPAAPLNPLPGSEAEARAIAEMFGIEPVIGKDATETAVANRMQSAQLIHLASHGYLQATDAFSNGFLSAIALAPTETDNGFLTVNEVMKMKLKAELVVLSACDSGRGTVTGDGITGLSRAYLTAGVPTAIVSLWPVSDRATAILMVNFYRAIGEGKSKAAALRAATLGNRDRFTDPKLWAPFTMYGTGR